MPIETADTPGDVDALFRRRLMERSGVDRLRMACDMFDGATTLMLASFAPEVRADPLRCRHALLSRRYWTERHDPLVKTIIAELAHESLRDSGSGPDR